MSDSRRSSWATVLLGGIGVAIFGFAANVAWEMYSHRSVGPEYVNISVRFEDDRLLLFVRNNSDEPLDLVRATIEIDKPGLVGEALGTYPDVSKVYEVSSNATGTTLEVVEGKLVVNLRITQSIEPGEADFGIELRGLLGPVDLSNARVSAELQDIEGNTYRATY